MKRIDYLPPMLHPGAVEKRKRTMRLKELMEPNTEQAVRVIEQIMNDPKVHAAIRLDAATRYLDRVYGKPKETIVVEDDEAGAGSTDEMLALLNGIMAKVGAPLIEAPGSSSGAQPRAEDPAPSD